jgi:hypothetical protein
MTTFVKVLTSCCVLAVATFAAPAKAEVTLGQPGSVLVFPLVDSTDAGNTLVTITNINDDHTFCNFPFRGGDIKLIFYYIDGVTWECTDLCEWLTPNDTLSILTNRHNPNMETGFLVVQAADPITGDPVQYDYLVGSATVVNMDFNFEWTYQPYSFHAVFKGVGYYGSCGRKMISNDGCVKFGDPDNEGEGVCYYDPFPDRLILNRFFGEGEAESKPGITFSNSLYLLSTMPSYPEPSDTRVNLFGYNNNERRFSRTFRFPCWLCTSLGEITGSVTQANLASGGNPDELLGVATGWLSLEASPDLDGNDVGLLGVFMEASAAGASTFATGQSLHFVFDDYGRARGKNVKICCGTGF